MSLTKAWSLIVILLVAVLAPLHVFAQTTSVSCLSPTYDWMNNTKNQNPCLVAAYLLGACVGGEYTIGPLGVNYYYTGPSASNVNPCQCSTVAYSLMSACGDCQNRTYESWSAWSTSCSTVYDSIYTTNIPTGTVVPHWAYLDVVTGDTFNPSAALQAGDAPESTGTKVQTTSSIVPSTTSASASLTTSTLSEPPTSASASLTTLTLSPTIATGSPSQTQSPTPTSKSSNVGAIAGGVGGGVAGIAAIAGLAAWFSVKRRRSTTPPLAAFSDIGGGPGYTQSFYSTKSHPFPMPTQMAQQPHPYDPSDPSTFPTSPLSPTTLTTSTTNIYQNPSIPSHVYSQGSRPGQYNGAPEV